MSVISKRDVVMLNVPFGPMQEPYFIAQLGQIRSAKVSECVDENFELIEKKFKSITKGIMKQLNIETFNIMDPKVSELLEKPSGFEFKKIELSDEEIASFNPNYHMRKCLKMIRKESSKK